MKEVQIKPRKRINISANKLKPNPGRRNCEIINEIIQHTKDLASNLNQENLNPKITEFIFRKMSKPCRFYLQGYCKNRKNCQFIHQSVTRDQKGLVTKTFTNTRQNFTTQRSTKTKPKLLRKTENNVNKKLKQNIC